MGNLNAIVLPGLDGSDTLLQPFVDAAPHNTLARVESLPDRQFTDYSSLADHFSETLCDAPPCLLIAESFSGPLAILLAHRLPELVQRLVLVATFATAPVPRVVKFLPWFLLLRLPIPARAARVLIGDHQELLPSLRIAIRQQQVATLASRISMLCSVDVKSQLAALHRPITYLTATDDRLISPRYGRDIASAYPKTDNRSVNGPHLILQTQPDECWKQILASLQTLP
ncbi:MAG TPA: hypothetical protein DDW52_13115 [Planctomycetaceae bacterium]|nr:hypothetical protein [Planctomycetaceae bacterium]